MSKWDLVVFDLDGTLLDTIDDLGAAVNHAMQLRGYALHTIDEYKKMVGHGVRNLVWNALPENCRTEEEIGVSLELFLEYYSSHIDVFTKPYPGIPEMIGTLASMGVKMAIASNKFHDGTQTLVSGFFPGIDFVEVLGNRPGAPLKPDAQVLRMIMDKAGVKAERTVMVGDSRTDLLTAANAGVTGVAVSWGFRPREDFDDAAFIADSVEELSGILF